MLLKDIKNPPKDFIFDRDGLNFIIVDPKDILRDGDEYKGKDNQWFKTSLKGQLAGTAQKYRRKLPPQT